MSIDRCNIAFRLYFDGMQAVKAFSTTLGPPGLSNLTSFNRERARIAASMRKDLTDAATTGWGRGVSDLQEAFQHLAANQGRWTDTNTKVYAGSLGRIHGLGPACDVTQAAANFLDAYEARLKEISDKLAQMKSKLSAAERAIQKVRNANTVGKQEWQDFGSALGELKDWSERAEQCLWVLRLGIDPHSTASEAMALGEEALGAAGKCLAAVALIRDTCELYDQSMSSGMSAEASVALLATQANFEATTLVAGFVEGTGTVLCGMAVLLAVYVKALTLIPDIHAQFTDIAQRQNMLAAQLGVDLRPWQR